MRGLLSFFEFVGVLTITFVLTFVFVSLDEYISIPTGLVALIFWSMVFIIMFCCYAFFDEGVGGSSSWRYKLLSSECATQNKAYLYLDCLSKFLLVGYVALFFSTFVAVGGHLTIWPILFVAWFIYCIVGGIIYFSHILRSLLSED